MDEFSVQVAVNGATAVATVTGDVDLAAADRLRAAVAPLIEPGREVAVDCAAIQFLDSTGLRVLIDLHREATRAGARFTLLSPSVAVARILDLAGIASHFNIREEAPE